jgi:hypothetical protein
MKRIGQYYICGGRDPDTRDHVIPDCFFAEPRPKNLLTLSAHSACNARFSLSDEYARNILAGLRSEKSTVAEKLRQGKIDRSVKGNRALRNHITAALTPKADKYSGDGICLGSVPGIRIDPKRFYPTVEKIVRGLHRLCAGCPMPSDQRRNVPMASSRTGARSTETVLPGCTSVAQLSCCLRLALYGNADDGGSVVGTVWWLRFYNSVPI